MPENEEIWHQLFAGGNAMLDKGRALLGKIPAESRCMFCHGPLDGVGGPLMSMIGRGQSSQQPHVCKSCVKQGDRHPGGTHVDIATVFADMRGSTPTAERIGDRAFTDLINRFYRTSSRVLVDAGALLGRLAGDQAIGYFVPGMAGPDYAQAALDATSRRKFRAEPTYPAALASTNNRLAVIFTFVASIRLDTRSRTTSVFFATGLRRARSSPSSPASHADTTRFTVFGSTPQISAAPRNDPTSRYAETTSIAFLADNMGANLLG